MIRIVLGIMKDRVMDVVKMNAIPKFYSLNDVCTGNIRNTIWNNTKQFFNKYLTPYIGKIEDYGDWTLGNLCCAQFVVHKSRILQHPKKMYKDIYEWLMRTNIDPEHTGRALEWTWSLIFDNPYKNRKLTKNNTYIVKKRWANIWE